MPFNSTTGRAAVHSSWAKTRDRAARTAKARAADLAKLEAAVDPDRVMSPRDRQKAAVNARKARMYAMSAKGVDARQRKRAEDKKRRGSDGSP